MTETDRIDTLETRIAHQDEVIEDLKNTVIAQWKEIDRLSRQVAQLMAQAANPAQSPGADPASEPPPPHW